MSRCLTAPVDVNAGCTRWQGSGCHRITSICKFRNACRSSSRILLPLPKMPAYKAHAVVSRRRSPACGPTSVMLRRPCMQWSPVRRGAWSVCHHEAAGSFSLSLPCRVVRSMFRSERRHAISADQMCLWTHDQRASAHGTTCTQKHADQCPVKYPV